MRINFLWEHQIFADSGITKVLLIADIEVVAVVTQPDRPKGRGKKYAVFTGKGVCT